MKCIILAAGYATRLYPLTKNFPKPLLELKGKPIIDWLIEDVKSCGIEDIILISNHKFINYFNIWAQNKNNITILDDGSTDNKNRLGAVKDIEYAIKNLKLDDDLLILAGDNLVDFSFNSFINYFNKKNTCCIMKWFEPNLINGKKYCWCITDETDKVIEMKEKDTSMKSNWLVPPFYIYKKDELPLISKCIEEGCNIDAPGSLVEYMSKKVIFHAFKMPGSRYDIGNLESYERIKKEYKGYVK